MQCSMVQRSGSRRRMAALGGAALLFIAGLACQTALTTHAAGAASPTCHPPKRAQTLKAVNGTVIYRTTRRIAATLPASVERTVTTYTACSRHIRRTVLVGRGVTTAEGQGAYLSRPTAAGTYAAVVLRRESAQRSHVGVRVRSLRTGDLKRSSTCAEAPAGSVRLIGLRLAVSPHGDTLLLVRWLAERSFERLCGPHGEVLDTGPLGSITALHASAAQLRWKHDGADRSVATGNR